MRPVEPLSHGEEILPLAIRAARLSGGTRRFLWLIAIGIADKGNDAIARGDVTLQLLHQGSAMLLEILLHHNLSADRAQIATQRVAAGLKLTRDGGEENVHSMIGLTA